jgi:hypothetical protein
MKHPIRRNQVAAPRKRPGSVTAIGWLFIADGSIGLVYHASELETQGPIDYDVVLVLFVRMLAIIAGVFMLRGADWARWLALLWMVYHVVLSALHSFSEAVVHVLLLAVIAVVLLRPAAAAYFRHTGTRPE